MSKVILFIAISQDSFIADKDGGVDWLPHPKCNQELELVGYKALMDRIGTIAMGSKSFEQITSFGEWAWKNKQTYVFTSKSLKSEQSYITMTDQTPREFLEMSRDKDIWLLGGSELAGSFERDGLIDEIILTVVPKTLNRGISLNLKLDNFNLVEERLLMDGMIQKLYLKKKDEN